MAELATEVGFPPGSINVVPGPGTTVGRHLVQHPGVDKIAFTGSTETGAQIMRDASDGIKRLTLELGGKSPNIVFADAALADATRARLVDLLLGGPVLRGGLADLRRGLGVRPLRREVHRGANCLKVGDPLAADTRSARRSRRNTATASRLHRRRHEEGAEISAAAITVGKGDFIRRRSSTG